MQLSYSPGTTMPNDHVLHLQPLDCALRDLGKRAQLLADQAQLLMRAATRNNGRMAETHAPRVAGALKAVADAAQVLSTSGGPQKALGLWLEYLRDRTERLVLTMDALREQRDIFIAHEKEGCPPVLIHDYEIALNGATLARLCNYMLLKIRPLKASALMRRSALTSSLIHVRATVQGLAESRMTVRLVWAWRPVTRFMLLPSDGTRFLARPWRVSRAPRQPSSVKWRGDIQMRRSLWSSAIAKAVGPPCSLPPPIQT